MRVLGLLVLALWLAPGLAACHHHRDLNAPGIIDPLAPPTHLASSEPEYPEDPGEHRLMLTGGVLGGGGGGSFEDRGFFEVGGEVTLNYGDAPVTHNDRGDHLLGNAVVPGRSYGVTLGWSALRLARDPMTSDTQASLGPIYVEGQTSWLGLLGFGAGWVLDPRTGATGPQVQGFWTIFYARGRVLLGEQGGWELGGGLQIKIPTTWTWRR